MLWTRVGIALEDFKSVFYAWHTLKLDESCLCIPGNQVPVNTGNCVPAPGLTCQDFDATSALCPSSRTSHFALTSERKSKEYFLKFRMLKSIHIRIVIDRKFSSFTAVKRRYMSILWCPFKNLPPQNISKIYGSLSLFNYGKDPVLIPL